MIFTGICIYLPALVFKCLWDKIQFLNVLLTCGISRTSAEDVNLAFYPHSVFLFNKVTHCMIFCTLNLFYLRFIEGVRCENILWTFEGCKAYSRANRGLLRKYLTNSSAQVKQFLWSIPLINSSHNSSKFWRSSLKVCNSCSLTILTNQRMLMNKI